MPLNGGGVVVGTGGGEAGEAAVVGTAARAEAAGAFSLPPSGTGLRFNNFRSIVRSLELCAGEEEA